MIIDGKQLQQNIMDSLQSRGLSPKILDIVYVGEDKVIEKYIHAKKKIGERLGVTIRIHTFDKTTTQQVIEQALVNMSLDSDGVLIQLPLPVVYDTQKLFSILDPSLDVDLLSTEAYAKFTHKKNRRLPPVVRACVYIFNFYDISLNDKNICIVGNGKLVGKPLADWFTTNHISFTQLTKETFSISKLQQADVIISGIGQSHFITEDMIQEGAIVIDAGTTEENGALLGDCHPDVTKKASLFTPVPGGVGPLTVVALFHNLFESYEL
jgi:methylenetetrahydrofolate dehydrogenase (NADP+) / methenyltetrahydrofolate cyclohydrolase